ETSGWNATGSNTVSLATNNTAPAFSSESPGNGTSGQDLSFTWSTTISDYDGHSFNWTIECNNTGSSSANGVANGTKSLSLSDLSYVTTYTIWVNATDSYEWTRESFTFSTRSESAPSLPVSFTATTDGRFVIELSWSNGVNTSYTWVENSTTETWARGEGTFLYNDTGTSTNLTGLDAGSLRYFQAWTWNVTDNSWNSSYVSANATTDSNSAPSLSSESPVDDVSNVEITQATVTIDIVDADGDTFNWTIEGENITND
ncbi:unnamed protein product, partial [marine sediment metagenome]